MPISLEDRLATLSFLIRDPVELFPSDAEVCEPRGDSIIGWSSELPADPESGPVSCLRVSCSGFTTLLSSFFSAVYARFESPVLFVYEIRSDYLIWLRVSSF